MSAFASVFLLLSGISGLIYEISWARLLAPHVGSDNAAISIVLASFFLGMALGSYLSAYVRQSKNHLITTYITLEMLIGFAALALLPIMTNLDAFLGAYPYFATSMIGKFILSSSLLILPTVCLGATFPIVVSLVATQKATIKKTTTQKAVTQESSGDFTQKNIHSPHATGSVISSLYAFNTLGAVIGSLATGFLLIPSYGLDGAIYVAAMINFAIAITAWGLRNKFTTCVEPGPISIFSMRAPDFIPKFKGGKQKLALLSLAISGFTLLACEVAWNKYLTILTGSSILSFSIILAVTLSGIAVGSWSIQRRIDRIVNPIKFMFILFLLLATSILAVRLSLNFLPELMTGIKQAPYSLGTKQFIRFLLVVFWLFPTTFLFGLLFPLALNLYASQISNVSKQIAPAYSLNTVAGVAGALMAGFWILPTFGTDAIFYSLFFLLLFIPVYLILFTSLIVTSLSQKIAVIVSVLGIAVINVFSKSVSFETIITAVEYRYEYSSPKNLLPEYLYLKEGENSIVSLVKYDDKYAVLQNNGLQEATIALMPGLSNSLFETLQAYVPYFIHEEPKSAFVVGYGGGTTTRAFVDTEMTSFDIVEIEKNVVGAIQQIPQGPAQALLDQRVNLAYGDARTALVISQKKYDIITSQPSHHWVAGAANLFTKEFFELVSARLNKGGIFSQWIALFSIDVVTFKAIIRAFYEVFPYGFSMVDEVSNDMMLIGSNQNLIFDFERIEQRLGVPAIKNRLRPFEVYEPNALFWFFALSRREIMNSTVGNIIQTDLNLLSETRYSFLNDLNHENADLYRYINATAKLDLPRFLVKTEAKFQLFEMGRKFLDWNGPEKSQLVAAQLAKIDKVWADSLKHEILYWQYNFHQATELYQSHTEWLDISHYRQFQISLKNEQWLISEQILKKIKSTALQQLAWAMLHYQQENWFSLLAMQPQTNMEQSWQLMARIRIDGTALLDHLAKITEIKYENLTQLKFLLKTYRQIGALKVAERFDALITVLIHTRLNFYAKMSLIAQQENDSFWLNALQQDILRLNGEG